MSDDKAKTMAGRFFIHATNVHQGGGAALLRALLEQLDRSVEYFLSLDERMPVPASVAAADNISIRRFRPTVLQRLGAESWLARSVARGDTVLCFGNLPPIFKLDGRVVVFVQNRYLIDDVALEGFPPGVRLRIAVERWWLNSRFSHVAEFVVQTPSMQTLLAARTGGGIPVRVLPFVARVGGYARSGRQDRIERQTAYDFSYVASGEPHKNHLRLVEAWCLLAGQGIHPSLGLTLDESRYPQLWRQLDALIRRHGLKVSNVGALSHEDVLALYAKSAAVIYPSTFESFGLPLVEARQANLPVLASELDYVRDVLDPEESFDPGSATSIARAVKRFLGKGEADLPLLDAARFLAALLGRAQ